jgi:hypothetical protein
VGFFLQGFSKNQYFYVMKYYFIFLLFTIVKLQAQNIDDVAIKNCNGLFAKFIPKNYTVLDSAQADFNRDGLIDIVFVIEKRNVDDTERGLLILQKDKMGYTLNTLNKTALYCKTCGGVYGDPYNGITFNNNVLKLHNYGGSSWRWLNEHTFRYQNKQWQLIGMSYNSYHNAACEESCDVSTCSLTSIDVNLSTKKAHYIETEDGKCIPKKDFWKKINFAKKVSLQNFNCNTDYFKGLK